MTLQGGCSQKLTRALSCFFQVSSDPSPLLEEGEDTDLAELSPDPRFRWLLISWMAASLPGMKALRPNCTTLRHSKVSPSTLGKGLLKRRRVTERERGHPKHSVTPPPFKLLFPSFHSRASLPFINKGQRLAKAPDSEQML